MEKSTQLNAESIIIFQTPNYYTPYLSKDINFDLLIIHTVNFKEKITRFSLNRNQSKDSISNIKKFIINNVIFIKNGEWYKDRGWKAIIDYIEDRNDYYVRAFPDIYLKQLFPQNKYFSKEHKIKNKYITFAMKNDRGRVPAIVGSFGRQFLRYDIEWEFN